MLFMLRRRCFLYGCFETKVRLKMNSLVRTCIRNLNCNSVNQRCLGVSKFLSFKSAISLENIYPKSNLSLSTPNGVPEDKNEKFNGFIPVDQLEITYSRSSGPGGQNVNTVNTKVDLRFHVQSAEWLKEDVRSKLMEEHKTKINKEGFLIIRSDKTRFQQLNLADAIYRLRNLIRECAEPEHVPSPETEEKLRRKREKAARIRLMDKRMRSQVKEGRQTPAVEF